LTALAFREMWCGRPGPVQLEIPAPVMYATGTPRVALVPPLRGAACGSDAQWAAAEPRARRMSLVVAGSGPDRGANAALSELVELLGCPVVTTMAGRSSFPIDHPHRLHGYGPAADAARREADVVCVLGSRLGNLDLPYDKYWGDRTRQKIIHIDVDPRHIGVTRPVTIGIVADLASALPGLLDALRALGIAARRSHDTTRYAETERQWRDTSLAAIAAWRGPTRRTRCRP
jgi:acetolactate synthase-1/2/3 large subunit